MLSQPGGLIFLAKQLLLPMGVSWNAAETQFGFPSGATLTVLFGQTSASVAASPGLAVDIGALGPALPAVVAVPPASTTPNLGALVGTPGAGAAVSPTPVAANAPALATPSAVSEPIRPVAYRFDGVPLPLALGFLLLVVPGVRAVRRYMFHLYGLGSSPP